MHAICAVFTQATWKCRELPEGDVLLPHPGSVWESHGTLLKQLQITWPCGQCYPRTAAEMSSAVRAYETAASHCAPEQLQHEVTRLADTAVAEGVDAGKECAGKYRAFRCAAAALLQTQAEQLVTSFVLRLHTLCLEALAKLAEALSEVSALPERTHPFFPSPASIDALQAMPRRFQLPQIVARS